MPESLLESVSTHSDDATGYDHRSWHASLTLGYRYKHSRTIIAQREHCGPLVVQKPFYPEGDQVCHTYLLHPPGGVVGGDRLNIDVNVDSGAHALITTPASTKFYRCDDRYAQQRQRLHVQANATLEWLPQDTIVFDQAKVKTTTEVTLENHAKFIGWEILCLGRPASDELFNQGYCRQAFEVRQGDRPVLIERSHLVGGSKLLNAAWGMAGYTVMGVMVINQANQDMLALSRQAEPLVNGIGSASLIEDLLVCRCLAHQGIQARDYFSRIWQLLRKPWSGRAALQPRIWNT